MVSIIYLILVVYSNNGVAVEKIPQATMKQCQVNATFYNSREHSGVAGGAVKHKAYCTVGISE